MKKFYITLLALAFCLNGKAQIITTVAGYTTTLGYSGDGGQATAAELNGTSGVAIDAIGNMYIADFGNNVIRKVNTLGIISTFAGNGTGVYSGDYGAATAASLHSPYRVALDNVGNLFIADRVNNRIRKVNTAGIITTIAGNGTAGSSGDGGPASTAEINTPSGLAFDGIGNLYIADYSNHKIRKVNTAGIITTIAGNGTQGFSGDGGQASSAELNYPLQVTVDASGNLYIADYSNNRIRKINTVGIISTFVGNGTQGFSGDGGTATAAELYLPMGVAFDVLGNLYIADRSNNRIRMVNTSGIITTIAGNGIAGYSGDGGQATNAELYQPFGVDLDASGNTYIADANNNRIRKVVMCYIPTVSYTLTNVSPHYYDAVPAYSSNVSSARWYWGDGTSTTGLYPSHTYSVAGTYSICVTVYSACGDSAVYCQNNAVSRLANNNSILSSMVYINVVSSIITATASPTTICAGSTTTLTASGATTYSWSPATGLSATTGSTVAASPTVTTTYTLVGTTGASTVSTAVTVSVNPLPVASFTVAPVCLGMASFFDATATTPPGGNYNWNFGGTGTPNTATLTTETYNYTYPTAGTFSVSLTFTDLEGCTSTTLGYEVVNPLPTIWVSIDTHMGTPATNSITMCSGTTATVSVFGATSYTWVTSAGVVSPPGIETPAASTTYTVTGTDANNCTNTVVATIGVNPLPIVTCSATPDTIMAGSSSVLSALGATTYSWAPVATLSAVTGSSVVAAPIIATCYTVFATDANGCQNTCTICVDVNNSTGINKLAGGNDITIYPNPNNGSFVIETNTSTKQTMQIYDVNGKLVLSQSINGKTTINASNLNEGVYNVSIIHDAGIINKRVVIVK